MEQGKEIGGKEGKAYAAIVQAVAKLLEELKAFEGGNSEFSSDLAPYRAAVILNEKHFRLQQRLARLRGAIAKRGGVGVHAEILEHAQDAEDALQEAGAQIEAAISKKLTVPISNLAKMQVHFRNAIEKAVDIKFAELLHDYDLSFEGNRLDSVQFADGFRRGNKSSGLFEKRFEEDVEKIVVIISQISEKIKIFSMNIMAMKEMTDLLVDGKFSAQIAVAQKNLLGFEKKLAVFGRHLSYLSSRVKMIHNMSPELDDYFLQRAIRFKFIDKVAGGNVKRRQEFIGDLKDIMKNYVHSGDSRPVLDKLAEGNAKFSGVHLRTLLNQLTVKILDLERKHRQQALPQAEIVPVLSMLPGVKISSEHERARDLFHSIPRTKENRPFVQAITDIYRQIILLNRYVDKYIGKDSPDGKAIKQLAKELRGDVDRFVLEKPHQKNKGEAAESYKAFQEIFKARLHSQDVVIRRHLSVWPVIANIGIGVATLGVALGIKLIHSKSTQGRYFLFFDNAKSMQRRVEKLEKSVKSAKVSEPKSPKK